MRFRFTFRFKKGFVYLIVLLKNYPSGKLAAFPCSNEGFWDSRFLPRLRANLSCFSKRGSVLSRWHSPNYAWTLALLQTWLVLLDCIVQYPVSKTLHCLNFPSEIWSCGSCYDPFVIFVLLAAWACFGTQIQAWDSPVASACPGHTCNNAGSLGWASFENQHKKALTLCALERTQENNRYGVTLITFTRLLTLERSHQVFKMHFNYQRSL